MYYYPKKRDPIDPDLGTFAQAFTVSVIGIILSIISVLMGWA